MECKNHASVPAIDRCTGCAEPFCADCLVEMHGQKYCGACKVMALRGQIIVVDEATVPCKEANEALTFALVSIFCFGFIFGPLSLFKAIKARKMIESDPRLAGAVKVTFAMSIAMWTTIIWIFLAVAKVKQESGRY